MAEDRPYEVTVHAAGQKFTLRTSARTPAEARDIARRVYDVRIEAKLIERSKADGERG